MSDTCPLCADQVDTLRARVMRLESILDDMDAAVATLYIGRDHGITPQADGALRDVCVLIRDDIATRRATYGRLWPDVRHTWTRHGDAHPVPTLCDTLSSALRRAREFCDQCDTRPLVTLRKIDAALAQAGA